jgi:hypothetical protein
VHRRRSRREAAWPADDLDLVDQPVAAGAQPDAADRRFAAAPDQAEETDLPRVGIGRDDAILVDARRRAPQPRAGWNRAIILGHAHLGRERRIVGALPREGVEEAVERREQSGAIAHQPRSGSAGRLARRPSGRR